MLTSVLQESQGLINNICFCYVAISDDISTHANFQVDGYHTTLLHKHIHHPLGTFSEVIVVHLLLTECMCVTVWQAHKKTYSQQTQIFTFISL